MTAQGAPVTTPESLAERRAPGARRRFAAWLHQRPRLQLRLLLSGPVGWLALAYLGALFILLLNAFFAKDPFSGRVLPFQFSLAAFETLLSNPVYAVVALRTLAMAVLVTLTDLLLAFPIAYYMARVASPRVRRYMVVAVLIPLWAAYLVKVYSWRIILQNNGLADWLLAPFGLQGPGLAEVANTWLVLSYLWLPYMILPIYAGLERIPGSLLEASADLGARSLTTFRRVVVPLMLPAMVAGSIFTFSLTMGDYITPNLVSNAVFIGNVIYDNSANVNLPLAAAYALLPMTIMIVYLLIARRLGAFDSL
jgi:putative spermidine/putrescine transport system permease protein